MPFTTNASFLSSILGTQASAEGSSGNNSQTMPLLQAGTSSIPNLKDKDGDINKDATINIVSDSALLPTTSHISLGDDTEAGDSYSDQISVYVVRKGDSLSQIADMFDVSVQTILAANDMKKGDKIKEGDILFILPISGLEHTITKGQTLKGIAKLYKVDISDIAAFNGITEDTKLAVGDKIMIPGGEMSDEGGDKPAPNLSSSVAKDTNYYLTHPLLNLFGFFINPVPTGHKTQGLHGPGHRGIDIGAPTGTPMYASASGKVIAVKTGCKVGRRTCGGGYGNMVIIEHANNTKTLYAHMSKISVRSGEQVKQGEIIGAVGNTGRSTGPHIHFEVFNAKNPGTDWSWAN